MRILRRLWLIPLIVLGSFTLAHFDSLHLDDGSRPDSAIPVAVALCELPGDVNQDGQVDGSDVSLVAQAWRKRSGDPGYEPTCDVVADGVINALDVAFVSERWGTTCPASPNRLWGVNMFEEISDPAARARVANAGINSVRLYMEWRNIEPTDRDLTAQNVTNYDGIIAALEADGLIPYITIQSAPSWAAKYACGPLYGSGYPGDDTYYQEFAELLAALVERYDGDDIDDMPGLLYPIHYFELYNEPDYNQVSGAPGGCWGGQDVDGDGVNDQLEYANLLKAVYPAMKAADPNSKLVFGSIAYESFTNSHFNMQFVESVLSALDEDPEAAANGYYFDALGFHKYDAFRDNWDGFGYPNPPACGASWTPLPGLQNIPYNQGVMGKAANLAWILGCHGLSKPMVASEVGLQVSSGGVPEAQRLEKQAHAVVHLMVRTAAVNMAAVSWYTLVDRPGELQYGLFDSSWQARLAYTAYSVVTSQLLDATFDAQLFPDQTGSEYIQAYRFIAPNGSRKLVLWTDAGCKLKSASCPDMAVDMTITADVLGVPTGSFVGRLRITGELGDVQYADIVNGSATIPVRQAPIYVQLDN